MSTMPRNQFPSHRGARPAKRHALPKSDSMRLHDARKTAKASRMGEQSLRSLGLRVDRDSLGSVEVREFLEAYTACISKVALPRVLPPSEIEMEIRRQRIKRQGETL